MSAAPDTSDEHQEDVISLLSQINYFSSLLEKEPAVGKIKDLFKKADELNAIKKGISHSIDDLAEHAPNKLRGDVQHLKSHWNKLEVNLQDDKEISELLKSSAHELKLEMDRIYYKSFKAEVLAKDADQPDRITSAVQPYFAGLSDNLVAHIEEIYPQTIKCLFELAVRLKEGKYGEKLAKAFGQFPDSISAYPSIALLLLIDLSRNPSKYKQEILRKLKESHPFVVLFEQMKQMKNEEIEEIILGRAEFLTQLLEYIDIPKLHWQAFLQIFNHFTANLANPSHLLVDLLLKMDHPEKAIHLALSLPHAIEQSKSLLDIVIYLVRHHYIPEAMELALQIKHESEKHRAIIKIIDKLLEIHQTDLALSFAQSLTPQEASSALQEIVIQLEAQSNLEKALMVANLISQPEIKAYTLSRLVYLTAAKGLFQQASEITFSIEDPDFREDAVGYIVKGLLNLKQVDEAAAFAESIDDPKEKNVADKIVESSLESDLRRRQES